MGLLKQIHQALVKPIVWPSALQTGLLYHLSPRSLQLGLRLQVQADQVAFLVSQGQIADSFYPGRYRFSQNNLPILATILDWPAYMDHPFKADVVFVSQQPFSGKWGTVSTITLDDPGQGLVQIRAYGTYRVAVIEPTTFLHQWLPLQAPLSAEQVVDRLRLWVFDAFSAWVSRSGLDAPTLGLHYAQLGAQIVPTVQAEFYAYGLALESLTIANLTISPVYP